MLGRHVFLLKLFLLCPHWWVEKSGVAMSVNFSNKYLHVSHEKRNVPGLLLLLRLGRSVDGRRTSGLLLDDVSKFCCKLPVVEVELRRDVCFSLGMVQN